MKKSKIREELLKLQSRSRNGMITPKQVVNAARARTSPLHSCFDWNDNSAAEKHREWQARQLIVRVMVVYDQRREIVGPVFVSLKCDRKTGGYRKTSDVLSSEQYRAEMLRTAVEELKAFQDRYAMFKELLSVFKAIKRVARSRKAA